MPWREACGQSTSISNEIRRNLDNYTSNQILGELLQNADDAGAERVAFMLDKRTHGSTRLYSSKNVDNVHIPGASTGDMASLQGPALLAYDSAGFKSDDWKGLMSFGQGSKKLDPTKTGKFGLGFNSVYHLTEVPQFVSGEYWVALDPQRRYVYRIRLRFTCVVLAVLFTANEVGITLIITTDDFPHCTESECALKNTRCNLDFLNSV